MKKFINWGLLISCSWLLFNTSNIFADEQKFTVSEENQELINNAVRREAANKDYIDGVINLYESFSSEKEFNDSLHESLIELNNYDNQQDKILQEYTEKYSKNIDTTTFSKRKARSVTSSVDANYVAAIGAYNAGIAIVRNMGHWQTANYMEHAIVPLNVYKSGVNYTPTTYYNKNDQWAKIVDGEELAGAYYRQLKNEAFLGLKPSGSFSGSYTFESGQLLTALHKVNYTISYRRQANGNYWTQTKVTDVFDFEWNSKGYNNFAIGFGNNYAALVQAYGYIKPFKIEIINEIAR